MFLISRACDVFTYRYFLRLSTFSVVCACAFFSAPAAAAEQPPLIPKQFKSLKEVKGALLTSSQKKEEYPISREEREAELSVNTRRHPEYDAYNIRVGRFVIAPSLTASAKYSDNLYARASDHKDDWARILTPEVKISTDLPYHMAAVTLQAEQGRYRFYEKENYNDHKETFDGRYDITNLLSVPVTASYAQNHAVRGDPSDPDGSRPNVSHIANFTGGLRYASALLEVIWKSGLQKASFRDDVTLSGVTINNSDRNNIQYTNYISAGLTDSSLVAPFVYASRKEIDYQYALDDSGINRDSMEWEMGGGTRFNFSKISRLVTRYGDIRRKFADPALKDISTPAFGAEIQWEPSTLLALNLSGRRTISEAFVGNAGASVDDVYAVRGLYELQPNILLRPQVEYLKRDYVQNTNYELNKLTSKIEVGYKINHNVWSTVEYVNIRQDVKDMPAAPVNTDTNTVKFSMKLQF